MNKLILSLAAIALLGFGCSSSTPARQAPPARPAPQPQASAPTTPSTPSTTPTPSVPKDALYVSFILNVHDWTSPDKSIATVGRVIDTHEKYHVPVDIYLDDPVVQMYASKAPDLLARLASSKDVAVSYHLRPPYPYYFGFDWRGLDAMTPTDLAALLTDYETHAIDLTTGAPTSAPGGYQYLKDRIGYAPYTVSGAIGGDAAEAVEKIYKGMGAQMTLLHGRQTKLGDKEGGLWLRPETLEIKAYEKKGHYAGEDLLSDAIAKLPTTGRRFLNLKWHEDNFYTTGTPWDAVYYEGTDRTKPMSPPFDLSLANDPSATKPKNATEQAEQWKRYEDAVAYVAAHPESMTALNSPTLLMLMP